MKTKISMRIWILVTLATGAIGFGGCADYVGVSAGYGSSYYVPDYRPFYVDYFYDGVPWWGPNYYYTRKKVVVKDVDKHVNVNKNIYYGGHHLVRDWTGRRSVARSGGFGRGR
jgi:hypothetical protein